RVHIEAWSGEHRPAGGGRRRDGVVSGPRSGRRIPDGELSRRCPDRGSGPQDRRCSRAIPPHPRPRMARQPAAAVEPSLPDQGRGGAASRRGRRDELRLRSGRGVQLDDDDPGERGADPRIRAAPRGEAHDHRQPHPPAAA
ncbi:MAG: hypothetical protein ACK55I_13570, partial [bacterium]